MMSFSYVRPVRRLTASWLKLFVHCDDQRIIIEYIIKLTLKHVPYNIQSLLTLKPLLNH